MSIAVEAAVAKKGADPDAEVYYIHDYLDGS